MTEHFIKSCEADEISLLDILVMLAESWKLLVLGPLLAGVLASGLSFLWPESYESVAIVRMTKSELALLNTVPVLDALIEKLGLLSEFDGSKDNARHYLAKKIVGKLDEKSGLTTITATDISPEKAQELCKAAINILLIELVPKGKSKKQVEQQILNNNRVIASLEDAKEQLQERAFKTTQNKLDLDVAVKYFITITNEIANREFQNIELNNSLEVRGDEFFVQQPSFSQNKVSPKRGFIVLSVILASCLVLLIFVFIRKVWASAMEDAEVTSKLKSIKCSL